MLRSDILPELAAAARVAGSITEDMKLASIEADGTNMNIQATDYDLTLSAFMPSDAIIGRVGINAKLLYEVVRGAGEELEMRAADGRITIKSSAGKHSLACLESNRIVGPQISNPATIKSSLFLEMLDATLGVVPSHFDSTYAIHGAQLKLAQGLIQVASTDQSRMAVSRRAWDGGVEFSGIISRKALHELHAILQGTEEFTFEHGPNALRFSCGSVSLTCKVIEGAFPTAVDRVATLTYPVSASLDGVALAEAARSAKVVSGTDYSTTKIEISGDQVRVASESPDGSFERFIPAEIEGGEVSFHVNGKGLAGLLALRKGLIRIEAINPKQPILLKPMEWPGDVFAMAPISQVPA